MISVLYISAGRKLLDDEAALSELLAQCRRNNAALGLTGMLLYSDGNFMQALEGEEEAVDALLAKIAKDRRHTGMRVLWRRPIAQRLFDGWSMALRRLADLPPEDRKFCSSLLAVDLPAGAAEQEPTIKMLESFRRSMS